MRKSDMSRFNDWAETPKAHNAMHSVQGVLGKGTSQFVTTSDCGQGGCNCGGGCNGECNGN